MRKIHINMKTIDYKTAVSFLIDKHYSGRNPQIKYAFGLYENEKLVAVCTYGIPASRSLCVGILGVEYYDRVIELNRLCRIEECKTNMSKFVSWTLKQLKQYNLLIVSYADTGMNHVGKIYQATNFLYTGKTKERTDKYTKGNKHSRHYDNDNENLRKVRTSKHRYIYFACSKGWKKLMLNNLKYTIEDYPNGVSKRYTLGEFQKPKIYDKTTNQYYYE